MKALLLINGQPPKRFPKLETYDKVFATDGAYLHFLSQGLQPDVVVGDFDSVSVKKIPEGVEVAVRPDQDFTDFDKCLQLIVEEGFEEVDVYGATGMEHDHFLGNLSTALQFKQKIEITFFDDYSTFYFTEKQIELTDVNGKTISLFPFPKAVNVQSRGLQFPLNGMTLEIGDRVGTRNQAIEDDVWISYEKGELLLFVSI